MAKSKIKLPMLLAAFGGLALIFGILEGFSHDSGSILFCLLFFVAISQGPLTIVAAADIVNSDWLKPYKKDLLSVYPMILCVAILFGVFFMTGKLHLYEWSHHPNAWLNENFFGIRNIALLLLAWIIAGKFVKESLSESSQKGKWAVIWVFTFVVSQTLVAFDWVMSLQYPWISTLFGAYFFVEAFYASLALAAVFTFFKYKHYIDTYKKDVFKKSQMDMMTLMFGFSIFWAYQFYSQYLVIWYGNIPEEVAFITQRMEMFAGLLYWVLIIMFLIPFLTLLFRKIKANPVAVMVIGILIWFGLLLERFFMITPHIPLNPIIVFIEFVLAGGVFFWVVKTQVEIKAAA